MTSSIASMTTQEASNARPVRIRDRSSSAPTRRSERARLRTDVALASEVLAPVWPLQQFIAVNPLGGLEGRPFEDAVLATESILGTRGTLDEPTYRREYARGRISDGELRSALDRRLSGALDRTLVLGGQRWDAADLLRVDLIHGTPAPAARRESRTLAERTAPAVAEAIDRQITKWCGAFLDRGQTAWAMPGRELGLFGAWRRLAPADRSLPAAARRRLSEVPERGDDALLWALGELRIAEVEHRGYLQAHLACLPGWAGHVRWRAEHTGDVELVDYLALRVVLERLLLSSAGADSGSPSPGAPGEAPPDAASRARQVIAALGATAEVSSDEGRALAALLELLPVETRRFVWLEAYEARYRDGLLADLTSRPRSDADRDASGEVAPGGERPAAQLVCCIDTRSELLRRHLEALGPYDTLGFAGFFAVAVRFQSLAGGAATSRCPVLIEPSNGLREHPAAGHERGAARHVSGLRAIDGAERSFHAAKNDLFGPFALAEASGWLAGPAAAARTFASGGYARARARLRHHVAPEAWTDLPVEEAFTFDERALLAEVALRMMGLTEGFGRLVVLCGHGSTTENNPYASALQCGACGGHPGDLNARTAAAILNGAGVREHLDAAGIEIPVDTWFVAAEHDTTSDRIRLLDRHLLPSSHAAAWTTLAADLDRAGTASSVERCASLPGAGTPRRASAAVRHTHARGSDWAQVYPEWGLAGNAAFIVGPRALTRGLDLGGRAFLHSYDATGDPSGASLESILTAPLVVAQWINLQYYFSTVDPDLFGAGTKTIHNVVGGIGVLAGPDGDLRRGLPWQSVAIGDQLVHEPVRLLAAVQAPTERIDAIVDRNPLLQDLIGNGWISLAARGQASDPWLRHTPRGWTPWTTTNDEAR